MDSPRPWPWVFLVIVLILASWFARHVRDARDAALASDCQSQLKQYGLALLNYHAAHGKLPPSTLVGPDGRPMQSWRVTGLAEWEGHDLFAKYNFGVPWDHPANAKFLTYDTPGFFYWCPNGDDRTTGMTSYVAVVGEHTAWPPGRSRTLAEFTDGPSNTILVVEVAGAGIHWMEPRDATLADLLARGPSSPHPLHVAALFADGSVHRIRKDVDRATLKALLTVDGGEAIEPRDWQAP